MPEAIAWVHPPICSLHTIFSSPVHLAFRAAWACTGAVNSTNTSASTEQIVPAGVIGEPRLFICPFPANYGAGRAESRLPKPLSPGQNSSFKAGSGPFSAAVGRQNRPDDA